MLCKAQLVSHCGDGSDGIGETEMIADQVFPNVLARYASGTS